MIYEPYFRCHAECGGGVVFAEADELRLFSGDIPAVVRLTCNRCGLVLDHRTEPDILNLVRLSPYGKELYAEKMRAKVVSEQSEEGRKDDSGKLRYDLLPPDALDGVVKIFTYGAAKYADRNWERGISYGRVFAAVMRHLWAWWRGQDEDDESGLSHLDHAMCGVMMLSAFVKRGRADLDDRPVLKPKV